MGDNFEKIDFSKAVGKLENMPEYDLNDLAVGKKLEVSTKHTEYIIERREDGFYVSGNPRICPEPIKAKISGSLLGQDSSSIKAGKVVEGGYLEFYIPQTDADALKRYVTSQIQLVEEAD